MMVQHFAAKTALLTERDLNDAHIGPYLATVAVPCSKIANVIGRAGRTVQTIEKQCDAQVCIMTIWYTKLTCAQGLDTT